VIHPLIQHRVLAGTSGLLAGAAAGAALVLFAGAAVASHLADVSPPPLLEATHLPPLLTRPGEQVELRYDAYCAEEEHEERTCNVDGTVFARSGEAGTFDALPLHVDAAVEEGRYVALVPPRIAKSRDGFTYYAVFRSESDAEITLPAGGATAPQRSLPLGRSVLVQLRTHAFGQTRSADARVAEAAWGDGPNEAGLEQGRNLPPIGGSSFDVGPTGDVYVLDEAHRSVLRWRLGTRAPSRLPLAVNGTLADMSVAEDGTFYVLETAGGSYRDDLLRIFDADGAKIGTGEIQGHASELRVGPSGPVVLRQPSGQWTPLTTGEGVLAPRLQEAKGRAGRPVLGGEVVLLRRESEIRAALVRAGDVRRSWIVTSETPLAEVQLAEPVGQGLVVVARVYTSDRDEFVALVLGERGLIGSFALDSSDWAETAPLSRFRVAGSSLYQLGSTPAGLFVDRFDLEVK
jgi:hypothetical protein